jgi:2-oxoglutarate dehydrogenase E1 component
MGGWTFIFPYILELTGKMAKYVGRKCSASPAVGSLAIHKYEQSTIVSEALDSE